MRHIRQYLIFLFTFWIKHLAFIFWYVALKIHQAYWVICSGEFYIIVHNTKHKDEPLKADGDAR